MHAAPLPDPTDPACRARAVGAAHRRRVHPAVLASLTASTPAQRASLHALENGVCVVTGQQAGLFGGPLYTLHKAACAIRTAQALQAETGVPCAPVFWLQDEDHDLEEIRTVTLLGADDTLHTAAFDADPSRDGCSIWAQALGPGIAAALDTLDNALGDLPHANEVRALHRATHRPDRSPAAAFRELIERLFAAHGLLVLDPAHPDLVDAAAPVHARAIDQADAIATALQAQSDALLADGRPAPVHVRPGAPLSFIHPDGLDQARCRVCPRPDGRWDRVGGGEPLSPEAMRRGPHSTSALLRPILQDTWLPTAAYVGGPGELAYLAQLPPLWRAFDLPMPLIIPRSRFLVVDGTSQRLLRQLDLAPADLHADHQALLARLGREGPVDVDALIAALTQGLSALDELRDGPLDRSAQRTEDTIRRAATKLAARVGRHQAERDAITVRRLDRIRARLAPQGAPQERVHGWPTYGARFGIDRFVHTLLEAVVPFDGTLREVHP